MAVTSKTNKECRIDSIMVIGHVGAHGVMLL